jgi:hypothetical protein
MQVRSTVSPEEAKEAVDLLKPKNFWLKFFAANWYATLIGIIAIGVNANLLIQGKPVRLGPSAGLLLFVAAALFYSWYRWAGKVSKAFLAASQHVRELSLEADGLKSVSDTGASKFVPWSSYESWSEGKSIFLLKGKDGSAILPVDGGSREALRSFLQTKIS